MAAKTFSGSFKVTPDEFSLRADRFILSEETVSFLFHGSDIDGEFSIEGNNLTRDSQGVYVGSKLPFEYTQWNDTYFATIKILQVSETKNGCRVIGEWKQDGDSWKFSGSLRPFRAKATATKAIKRRKQST